MAFLRNKNREKFTVVDNQAIRDKKLSLKAIGLLVSLLSLPDDWEFSENGLIHYFEKDGQASIRSGLKELEENGYLKRAKRRDEKGKIKRIEWIIYENPHLENPILDNPSLDNPPQLKTNQLSTEEKEVLNSQTPKADLLSDKVVNAFCSICPSLPKPSKITETRKNAIKNASKDIEAFGGWEKFFNTINNSDFLSGRTGAWKASFDWCLKSANRQKIIEGNYINKSQTTGTHATTTKNDFDGELF